MANKRQEILLRANLGFVAMCLLGLSIVVRAGYIQMVQGEHYRSLADSLTIFPKTIFAERGNIYSENGRLLATTLPTFDVRIDFKTLQNNPELFKQHVDSISILLATTFGDKSSDQYKAELKKEYRKRSRYYLLKRNVTYNQMEDMKSWPLFRKGQYKSGMIAVQNDKRLMPFGLLAKRTIGFTNSDGRMVGLEGKFDEILKGTQGKVMVQKIAGGVTIPLDSKEQITPEPGHDIYTTLDIELQDVAEDALYRALQHHQAGHGCVVLMEVKTGKIKAIANLSTNKDSTYGENFNFAVGEATEPGSTFKLATVAALMEDGLVTANTKVDMGNGIATFYNLPIKDHEAPEIPVVTLQRAIEISSNVAVAKLAHANYSATPKKFYNHLEDFGFTKKIDIELSGAAQPKLADVKKWSGVSTAYLAHGYELQITPLHTLMFYNAIANNGTMVVPHLVDRIKSYNQTVDTINTTILKEDMLSESTVKQLRKILEGVVENGTAMNLKTDYLRVAGKTGTAVIAQGSKGYKKDGAKVYQASFCGYFPAEDPKYSMIVVINSPSTNGYYGNLVAGSIFKEVADKVYSLNLQMHKPFNTPVASISMPIVSKGFAADLATVYSYLGKKVNQFTGDWATVTQSNQQISLIENELTKDLMPDVVGMTMRDALYLLEGEGLRVNVSGFGKVVSQSVLPGERVNKGTVVAIELR